MLQGEHNDLGCTKGVGGACVVIIHDDLAFLRAVADWWARGEWRVRRERRVGKSERVREGPEQFGAKLAEIRKKLWQSVTFCDIKVRGALFGQKSNGSVTWSILKHEEKFF